VTQLMEYLCGFGPLNKTVLINWLFSWFQMKVSMDEFKNLAARYRDLHQSSFDADYATLRNVELYPYVHTHTHTPHLYFK